MFSSKAQNRPKKRLLQMESLEQREMLSVAPLSYSASAEQPAYSSNFSTEAVAVPAPTPSEITATSVKLAWDASTMTGLRPEDPFKIEKSTTDSTGAEKWVQVGSDIPYSYTIGAGTYSYELKGLTSSTTYKLRVSFGSTVLGRGYTEAVTVSTLESELNAEALSSTSIKLSWNIAGKTGTWFTIQKRLVGAQTWDETGLQVKADGSATATKTSTVEGLAAATAYEFQVTYNDTAGATHSSQVKACTTLFVLDAADGTVNSVNLAWNAAMGGTAHEVQIYTGTAKPTETTAWSKATVENTVNPTEYKITGLKENLSYYFRVRYTVTENGESVTKYTDVLHYSTPTSIKLENATEKSINVSWTFSGTSGTPYYIQYKEGGNWIDYPGANTTSKSYTLNNLDAGTAYEIRVRYTNSSGTAYSAASTLKTGVATKLVNVTASSAEISWNIPGLSGTAVNIQRCDGSLDPTVDTNWRTIATGITMDTYTNNNIGSNNKYYYRVSYSSGGETLYTIHVSALTNATVTASEASQDSVKLDWNFTPKQGTNLTVQFCQSNDLPANESSWGTAPSVTRDSDDLGCTVNGLTPGFNYFFRVLYTSSLGTEQQTSSVTKRIGTIGDNLIASEITDTTVTLRWAKTGFTSQQSKGFIVYCQDLSGAYGTNGVDNQWKAIATVDASQNHYTVSGLRGDTRYNFKIAYADGSESQAVSMQLDLTTKPFTVDVLDLTQTSAKLEWSFSTDKDPAVNNLSTGDGTGTYIIQRYIGTGEPGETARNLAVGDNNWQEIGTAPYNMTQPRFNLSTLTKNTTYYYRIVYTYRTGPIADSVAGSTYTVPLETKFSEIVTVKTKSDIRTSSIGSNSINIAWDAKTGATNYTVQYRVSGATGWTDFGSPVTGTSTICIGLNADTEYDFQVVYNGTGTQTATVTAKTAKNLLSIASKELGIGTAAVTVEMQYAAGESNFVLNYRQKGEETDPWSNITTPISNANGIVSFELPGLIPETEYEFKIVYEANSQSHETEVKSVSLSDDLMPANVSGTSITIRWEDAAFPDKRTGTSYVLQYRVVGGTAWLNGPAPSSNSSTVSGLAANTEYEFRVQYTSDGGTAYSTLKTVQTKQPTVNVSTPQVGAVKLTWSFESVDGYIVQYKTATGTWSNAVTVSANASREATVTNLPLETEYTFRIAYKTSQSLAANETVYSDEAEITTLSGFSVVENSIGSQSVSVKWDYVTDSTYRLQYRITGTQNWIEIIPDIAKSTKTYTLPSLTPGTSYTIQLVYVYGTEQTVAVTAVTTKVAPEAPTGLSVSEIKSDGAKIKWTDNSEYEDDYIIEVISNVTGKVVKTPVGEGVGTGEMTQTLTGLDTKTSYTVKIYAKNTEGSSVIAQATFTTLDITRPAAVTTVKAVTTPKSITLSWKIKSTTGIPDPTQFRIEYYDDKVAEREKLWYEVQLAAGAITYDSTAETYSCTISDDFSIGESLTITLENKKAYQFRIIALAPNATYGNAAATAISATTAALVTPSSLSAKDITLTTATISFKDTDKNVAAADKVYTLYYAPGAKKYTDWSKVPTADIQSKVVSSSDLTTILIGLKAETVYSYIIESDYQGEKTATKPSSFTTAKMPLATTVKGGYTLVGGTYSFLISWKPPATKVLSADVSINYSLEVSISGKKDTFVPLKTAPASSTSTLQYTTAEFAAVLSSLSPTGKATAIYFRVASAFEQGGVILGTSYSSNGRVALPKIV